MKKVLKWSLDFLVAPLAVIWATDKGLDGVLSGAADSWQSFGAWLVEPIDIPRWLVLILLGSMVTYGAGMVIYVLRKQREVNNSVDGLASVLVTAFESAAEDIEQETASKNASGGDLAAADNVTTAVAFLQLDKNESEVLQYFARQYSRGDKWKSAIEASSMCALSVLRTDQVIDRLLALGLLDEYPTSKMSARQLGLSNVGREWLLAHGHQ